MTTTTDLQAQILATLEPGDDHPDPDGIAEALCRHCQFPITRRRVPTGKTYVGPFWRTAWVHTDTLHERCWTPCAAPDRHVPNSPDA